MCCSCKCSTFNPNVAATAKVWQPTDSEVAERCAEKLAELAQEIIDEGPPDNEP